MSLIYQINKGINRPIEFSGLKGQYIAYLAVGLVVLLLLFIVMYLCGVSLFVLLPLVFGLGAVLYVSVTRLSKRFGVHGLEKFLARRSLPGYVQFTSRRLFLGLRVTGSNAERQGGDA